LHVISSIRRMHKVKLPALRKAVAYLRTHLNSDRPLLDRQMLTDGKDLFIEQYGNLVSISADGQMAMRAILADYLARVEWDVRGMPIRLFPYSREKYSESPKIVYIDPKIRFGKPCISGTRIPTAIIAERYQAGDSMRLLEKDYGLDVATVEEAIRYESRVAS
jgi:uncharacterized protein (DUF433 family)